MKNDIVMYEQVYRILKDKIENGRLREGTKIPSRSDLCHEYHTSEKTIRKALELLKEDGLIYCEKRKCPIVAKRDTTSNFPIEQRQVNASIAYDIMKSGAYLCYPLNEYGIHLCSPKELAIAEDIIRQMDLYDPQQFWLDSKRVWRFFISRIGNDLIFRVITGLGFSDVTTLPGTYALRSKYKQDLLKLMELARLKADLTSVQFDDFTILYDFMQPDAQPSANTHVCIHSPLYKGVDDFEQIICKGEDRCASVYMDLLSMMVSGQYKLGDRLPSIIQLHQSYNVSIKTASKAVQQLQQWGAVTSIRGKGIHVVMKQIELTNIHLDPSLVAHHVRRFLDSLEFLMLIIEQTAQLVAQNIPKEDALQLRSELTAMWDDYQIYHMSSRVLLNFITNNIPYQALRVVYELLQRNFRIGRSIPCLLNLGATNSNREIHERILTAIDALIKQDISLFATLCKDIFTHIYQESILACKHLNYYDAAMKVYDGTILWK